MTDKNPARFLFIMFGSILFAMSMKKWIICIVMLAFVVTAMPFHSHAAMTHDEGVKAAQTEKAESHGDCHHDGHKAADQKSSDKSVEKSVKKTASGDEPCKGSCCDKSCKCIGNSCGGAVKVLGDNGLNLFSPIAAKSQFGISQDRMVSNLTDRIKRPPRA